MNMMQSMDQSPHVKRTPSAEEVEIDKLYRMVDEIRVLVDEYKEHEAKRTELEKAHPTPTGSFDYDYLYLRGDLDYRWAVQRQSEIREAVGGLMIYKMLGITR